MARREVDAYIADSIPPPPPLDGASNDNNSLVSTEISLQ